MIEQLFYWLIDRLADFLGGLNPERAKKVAEIKAEGERLDALAKEEEKRRAESELIYKEHAAKRAEWDRLASEIIQQEQESKERAVAAQMRIDERNRETEKLNTAVDARSDDERFSGVPRG